jgi:asparagine synthase (glutamine-hydrolysing)
VCGILGHFAIGRSRAEARLWRRLVNLLAHRGPDDSTFWSDGRFTFGHRRLSIIDLSSAGRQPMPTDDGQFVVTFNGEIYNYVELREELAAFGYRFQTRSDTEVLLHGYRQWGTSLPVRLRGMFAFAIADRRRQELFVARDRFGEKPLFVHEDGSGISFASELKALAALPHVTRELNDAALAGYLCLNYVPGEDTMVRGITRVRQGSWRLWTAAGASRTDSYWQPPRGEEDDLRPLADATERLETLLDESTRLALRSDVPVGVLLSGGIDSSLVARSAARSGRLSAAYCLTFAEESYSEWPKAERTARQLGVPLVEVRLDAAAVRDFDKIVDHGDDPLADSSSLAVWTLSREVSRQNKVVLSGDGGDELFGGYLTYRATLLHAGVTSRLPMPLRRALARLGGHLPTNERKVSTSFKLRRFLRASDLPSAIAHFTWNGTWLPEEAARLLSGRHQRTAAAGAIARLASKHGVALERPTLRQMQLADIAEYLPNDILTKSDRMSMAHGLEIRSPFLDPELAEFALRLPDASKLSLRGPGKRVLRELAKRSYDVDVAGARKQGFSIPVHAWLRGPARPLVEDLLAPASLASLPALDPTAVSRAVADHMSGRRSFGFELWGLAVLVAWHRRYVQHRIETPADAPLPDVVDVKALACDGPI